MKMAKTSILHLIALLALNLPMRIKLRSNLKKAKDRKYLAQEIPRICLDSGSQTMVLLSKQILW
jgi:hypothetical protein